MVGVWVGNADNSSSYEVSGQLGAGSIWAEIMNLILNSDYNKKTPFKFNLIKEFQNGENIEYGLKGDDYEKNLNILKERDKSIILNPHDGDSFLLEKNTKIVLEARKNVKWFINSEFLSDGENVVFVPQKSGQYKIEAEDDDNLKETVTIFIVE